MKVSLRRSAVLWGLLFLLSGAAILKLKQPIETAPRDGVGYYSRGVSSFNLGQYDKAAEWFNQGVKASPRDGRNYSGLGWTSESQGDHRAALEWFRKAAEISPGDPAIPQWAKKLGAVAAARDWCSFKLLELRSACSGLFAGVEMRDNYERSYAVARLVFALFCLGLLWRAPALFAHFGGISRKTWMILAASVLGAFLLLKPLAPNTVSDPNNHGVQRVADVRDDGQYCSLSIFHGNGYSVLVENLYKHVFHREVSIFSIGFVITTAASVLLFLLAFLMFQDEHVALFSTLLLLLLPAHLRMAASESMFVAVEFYLVATLLLFQLFVSTQDRSWLFLGSLSLFLLMQTRAELLLLGPVLLGLFLLSFLRREAFLKLCRGKLFWAGVLGFIVLFWPWLAWVAEFREPRMTEFAFLDFPLRRVFAKYGPPTAFFSLDYTPIVYPALFLAGLLALFTGHKRALLFLNAAWLVLVCFYMAYIDSIDTYLRTGLASYPLLVLVAAFGAESLAKLFEKRLPWRHYRLALAALLVLSLLPKRGFVAHLSGSQVEFRFLQKVDARLPARAVLVHLARPDLDASAGTFGNTYYVAAFLGDPSEKRTLMGIREYLKAKIPKNPRRHFFYKGGDCYRPGWAAAPGAKAPADGAAYIHPLCRNMESSFTMVPFEEEVLDDRNDGLPHEALAGKSARIGLYEIVGRK